MGKVLGQYGYKGCWCQKLPGGECSKRNGRKESDSVAIFYKTSRIDYVASFDIPLPNGKGFRPDYQKRSKQAAMIATLRTKSGKMFNVLTGHFKSGDEPEDVFVKKVQVEYLNGVMMKLFGKESPTSGARRRLNPTGEIDINLARAEGFDFLKNVCTTTLPGMKGLTRRTITKSEAEELICGLPLIFACDFNTNPITTAFQKFEALVIKSEGLLDSAYPLNNPGKFSSLKWRRGGNQRSKLKVVDQTIDFIFYSKGHFNHLGRWLLPTHAEVRESTEEARMPFWNYPSDHFALGSDLQLKAKKSGVLPFKRDKDGKLTQERMTDYTEVKTLLAAA